MLLELDGQRLLVDPGGVTKVAAWPVAQSRYGTLQEGSTVRVERGRWFGYVYDVEVTTASKRGDLFADPAGAL